MAGQLSAMNSCQANAAACCSVAFGAPPVMSDGSAGLTSIATCPRAKPPEPAQMHMLRPTSRSDVRNRVPPPLSLSSQQIRWACGQQRAARSHRSAADDHHHPETQQQAEPPKRRAALLSRSERALYRLLPVHELTQVRTLIAS